MFEVAKSTLPRYWYAYAGSVTERFGEPCEAREFFAFDEAFHFAYASKCNLLAEDLYHLKNRHSRLALRIFAIRALWNSAIREGLARHRQRIADAQEAFDSAVADPKSVVLIDSLPDMIPVLGNRLAIGTPVYSVDTWAVSIKAATITTESINYYESYPDGVAATYTLSDGRYTQSDMKTSYSNVEQFLDKDQAITRLRALMADKVHKIDEQIKNL